jgi:hypothetical protein
MQILLLFLFLAIYAATLTANQRSRTSSSPSVTASTILKRKPVTRTTKPAYYDHNGDEEPKDNLDAVIALLDDPRTDLFVGIVAGGR